MLPLFRQRTVWVPTIWGVLLFVGLCGGGGAYWWFKGEEFLSLTRRETPEVLIVEGWIDDRGSVAAAEEFRQQGYQYIVATGGLTGRPWNSRRWSYAEETQRYLLREKVPAEKIILAVPREVETQRTFEMAVASKRAIEASGLHPKTVTVFTRGCHARRSRLVFAKVFGPGVAVGAVAWHPPGYRSEPWWRSTDRGSDFMKETVGYFLELLVNSGRTSNSAPPQA